MKKQLILAGVAVAALFAVPACTTIEEHPATHTTTTESTVTRQPVASTSTVESTSIRRY